jgi:hypothetical protein
MSFADHEDFRRELSAPRGEQAAARVSQTLEPSPTFRELREIIRALRAFIAYWIDKWQKGKGRRRAQAAAEDRGQAPDGRR